MTAEMTSFGSPSRSGTSCRCTIWISGTETMTRSLTIWESAVAACPAPMFAISRSPSSCRGPRSLGSILLLDYAERVEHERGPAIGQQRHARKDRQCANGSIEVRDQNLLATDQLIDGQCTAPFTDFGDHRRALAAGCLAAKHGAQPHQRQIVTA